MRAGAGAFVNGQEIRSPMLYPAELRALNELPPTFSKTSQDCRDFAIGSAQPWHLSHRFDPRALPIADRHYNRQKPGSPQFVPPGRCVVLLTEKADALWVTSWPFAEFVRHAWPGAWINSCFRNESAYRSSDLIRAAIAATCAIWSPAREMVTFIDRSKVRKKRDYGRCYRRAGFHVAGETKGGLLTLRLWPSWMPAPLPPIGYQPDLTGISL